MPPNNPMTEGEALAVDYSTLARDVARTLQKAGAPLTEDQILLLAGSLAVYVEAALTAHTAASGGEVVAALTPAPSARDADGEVVAMHWIDRYASGIDSECQLDRVAEALGGSSDDASDAARYRWLRRALLGAEDDPIDSLLLEKEPETEAEFDAAVDAALAQKGDARGQG